MILSNHIKVLRKHLRDSSLSREEYIRVQSVLLRKKRKSYQEILQSTGASEASVKRWHADFNKGGIDGLRTQKRLTSPNAKLTKVQKDSIKNIITGHKPQEYGYSGDFWSVASLKQLVRDQYGVVYKTAVSYYQLFSYCGFSYQKAEYVDAKKVSEDGHFKKRFSTKLKKGGISMWW